MQFEKFWGDKNSFADAERRHYESLAKGSEKAPKKKAPIRENFWVNKKMYEDAERQYYEKLAKSVNPEDAKCVLPKKEEKAQAVPVANVPAVNVPAVNVPAVNVPAVNVPAVNIPAVNVVPNKPTAPAVPDKPTTPAVPDKPTAPAVPEKTSKRNRKHKGSTSISVSESSNRDSISEVPLPSNDEIPATTSNENPSKKSKKNKNKKNQNQNEKVNKTEEKTNEVCEVPTNLEKGGNVQLSGQCSLAGEVEKARQHIKKSLECMDSVLASVPNAEAANKITFLADQVSQFSSALNDLRSMVLSMKTDVEQLKATVNNMKQPVAAPAPAPAAPAPTAEDTDDGVDLFASESEDDEEANKIKEARLAAYAAKKSKKPALIAKSSIILDCKPWDDETDMGEMEKRVRVIACDGLLWGASKLVPLAYGIKKLQINCVVEDEKVSIDWLQEEIEKIEDFVQSCDVAAFNKI